MHSRDQSSSNINSLFLYFFEATNTEENKTCLILVVCVFSQGFWNFSASKLGQLDFICQFI